MPGRDEHFVIMARTDALAVEGLEPAIERACAYVEAGADMIFPEAVTELDVYRKFADAVGVPVLANITEFGSTPLFTTEELAAANVSLVLYPLSAFRAMSAAALKVYQTIRAEGTQKNVIDIMQTREDLYEYLGYHAFEQKLDDLFAKGEHGMSETSVPEDRPPGKKSVALSGVVAGDTEICTVGQTGSDLHYRGYDILEFSRNAEFEEIAYLLVHGKLPTMAELHEYKAKLKSLRGLSDRLKRTLEAIPSSAHPMDVLRTGVSVLGCCLPEEPDHSIAGARDVADRLLASLGSMLLYWYHFATSGKRIDVETDDDSIGGHFLHLLHGEEPRDLWVRCMHTSLILYAEHEFNASTFTSRIIASTGADMYSAITGAIGALRGPKHGGANEVAFEIQQRYETPDEAEVDIRQRMANKEIVIGFGHPVYTIRDPRNEVIKRVARTLAEEQGDMTMFYVAERIETCHGGDEEAVCQPRLVLCGGLPPDGCTEGDVHATVRDLAHLRLGRSRHRTADRRQDHPPQRELHRSGEPEVRADRGAWLRRQRSRAARPAYADGTVRSSRHLLPRERPSSS